MQAERCKAGASSLHSQGLASVGDQAGASLQIQLGTPGMHADQCGMIESTLGMLLLTQSQNVVSL